MKYLVCFFFVLSFCTFSAQAKYKTPADVKSVGTKTSNYIFYNQDVDKDGKLTLEEFKNQRMTKDVEQKNRLLKKKGLYKSPEEQFKIMDEDGDGKISPEDLSKYLDEQRKALNSK